MLGNRTKSPVYSREGGFEQFPEVVFRGYLGCPFERCTTQFYVFAHDPLGSFPMDIGDPATEYPRVEYAPIFTVPGHVLFGAARLPIDPFCRLYPREPFKFQGHGPPATVTALIHSTLVSLDHSFYSTVPNQPPAQAPYGYIIVESPTRTYGRRTVEVRPSDLDLEVPRRAS